MTIYKNFPGIDIGKFSFMVSVYGLKSTIEYENTSAGIDRFMEENKNILPDSLCVVETTGGYELAVIYRLREAHYKIHRADSRKVKSFIRSFGNTSKTDSLDAKAPAKYGYERGSRLEIFILHCKIDIELFQLVQRRIDLKSMLVAEKNRLQSPSCTLVKEMIEDMVGFISKQIQEITDKIHLIIECHPDLKRKRDILKTIPGIGDIIAFELLILLPELGKVCRGKIASLAGVAPRADDSGKFSGYRRTGRDRSSIKPILFMAAMAARNSKTQLKEFYEKLIHKGKVKMVALTALMRKILVIANAGLKQV